MTQVLESKFSQPIEADSDAFYMSCPEIVGAHVASRLVGHQKAVELCCAVGLLSIQLAKRIQHVTGIDLDARRLNMARRNARLYGVSDKTTFLQGDALSEKLLSGLQADVVVLDPDWSTEGQTKDSHATHLNGTQPNFIELIHLAREYVSKNIVARIPRTITNDEIRSNLGNCEIEKISWGGKVRFKIAYRLQGAQNTDSNLDFTNALAG